MLLPNLRDHLATFGIVRAPSDAIIGYPMWLDPRNGVPAPAQGDNPVEIDDDCVIGAFQVSGFARRPYEATYLRTDVVDIWIRVAKAPTAYDVDDAIRLVLSDKRQYTLGSILILESLLYRPLQRLGSNDAGYTFTTSYTFERSKP